MIWGALRGFAVASGIGYVVSKAVTGVDRRFHARNNERKASGFTADHLATDAQRKAAVEAYLAAMTDPDGAFAVPMAPDVVRLHGGIPTSIGREHVQWDLYVHLQYRLVGEIEITGWTIGLPERPDVLRVEYVLRPKLGPLLRVTEDFTVPAADGLIHRIEGHVRLAGDQQPATADRT